MPKAPISRSAECSSTLLELTAMHGILPAYTDISGQGQTATPEALQGTLRALGVEDARSESAAIRARRAELASRALEPTLLAWDGSLPTVTIRLPRRSPLLARGARWSITLVEERDRKSTRLNSSHT